MTIDVLSDILATLRIKSDLYFCNVLEPPWQLDMPADGAAHFHVVRTGCCWFVRDSETIMLHEGDLVFVSPTGGDASAAARLLAVGRSTFYRKLARHGIPMERGQRSAPAVGGSEVIR